MSRIQLVKRIAIAAALAGGIPAAIVWATPSSGSVSTLIGRATYESFKVDRKQFAPKAQPGSKSGAEAAHRRRRHPIWEVEVEARPNLDIATQSITFQPGAQSGWHSHPGPVFISVVSGTMTFYESDDPDCQAGRAATLSAPIIAASHDTRRRLEARSGQPIVKECRLFQKRSDVVNIIWAGSRF